MLDEMTSFFGSDLPADDRRTLTYLGVTAPESKAAIMRLEWPVFDAALKSACCNTNDALPVPG